MSQLDAATILERAAMEMETRGKCEGDYTNAYGSLCTFGAMNVVMGRKPRDPGANISRDELQAIGALRRFCGDQYPDHWSDTNDAPTVIAGLRAVAMTLRAQSESPALVMEVV